MKAMSVLVAKCIGVLGLASAALVLVHPVNLAGLEYSWKSASLLLALQVLLSCLLLYAAEQRRQGSEIAEKAFPAAVMAVVLWVCMFAYWLQQAVIN